MSPSYLSPYRSYTVGFYPHPPWFHAVVLRFTQQSAIYEFGVCLTTIQQYTCNCNDLSTFSLVAVQLSDTGRPKARIADLFFNQHCPQITLTPNSLQEKESPSPLWQVFLYWRSQTNCCLGCWRCWAWLQNAKTKPMPWQVVWDNDGLLEKRASGTTHLWNPSMATGGFLPDGFKAIQRTG